MWFIGSISVNSSGEVKYHKNASPSNHNPNVYSIISFSINSFGFELTLILVSQSSSNLSKLPQVHVVGEMIAIYKTFLTPLILNYNTNSFLVLGTRSFSRRRKGFTAIINRQGHAAEIIKYNASILFNISNKNYLVSDVLLSRSIQYGVDSTR